MNKLLRLCLFGCFALLFAVTGSGQGPPGKLPYSLATLIPDSPAAYNAATLPSNTGPSWAQFLALEAQLKDCCPSPNRPYDYGPNSIPQSYNNTAIARPVAQKVDPCRVPTYPTQYEVVQEVVYETISFERELSFIKIAAVREGTSAGGMPRSCFTTTQLGTYTAAKGYTGVFLGPYSAVEAKQIQETYLNLGFCNAKIYVVKVEQTVSIPLYYRAGQYVQRE